MKLLIKIGLLLLVGLLLLGLAGYFLLPPATKKVIESGSGSALGTTTQLEKIKAGFGFGSTSMGIAGFTAEQPSGFSGDPFLKIGDIDVDVKTFSVLSDTVKVPKVSLDGLELRLIQNGKESNFLRVYESLSRLTQGSGEPAPETPETEAGSGKAIDIGVVSVQGVKGFFDLTGIPGIDKSYSFELPAFEVDISKDANAQRIQSVEQAVAVVVSKVIEQTVAKAKSEVSPELAALIGGDVAGLKARVDAELEKWSGKAGEKMDELQEEAENKAKELIGDEAGKLLEGAVGGEAADKLKDSLGEGAGNILDGAKDKLLKDGAEDSLKKGADKTLEKGTDALRKKAGGLLKGGKDR